MAKYCHSEVKSPTTVGDLGDYDVAGLKYADLACLQPGQKNLQTQYLMRSKKSKHNICPSTTQTTLYKMQVVCCLYSV